MLLPFLEFVSLFYDDEKYYCQFRTLCLKLVSRPIPFIPRDGTRFSKWDGIVPTLDLTAAAAGFWEWWWP